MDYYSRFIEIALLVKTTAAEVIGHTKRIFTIHGIPEIVVSDNGPQFASEAYRDYARKYQFKHINISPYYPKSNGKAEQAVGTIKKLLEKEEDPYLALSTYCNMPLQVGYTPSGFLMGRKWGH